MVKKRTGLVTKAYLDGAIQHVLDVLGGWIQELGQETGGKIEALEQKFDARFAELGRVTRLEHLRATN